jgi:hypothetical protein
MFWNVTHGSRLPFTTVQVLPRGACAVAASSVGQYEKLANMSASADQTTSTHGRGRRSRHAACRHASEQKSVPLVRRLGVNTAPQRLHLQV